MGASTLLRPARLPLPLDGTDEGVDRFLWEVINRCDLTNTLPADEVARVAAGSTAAADWAARAE